MTTAQESVFTAALLSAKMTVAILKQVGIELPYTAEKIFVCAIMSGQVAVAQSVAQYPANDRAEIAMLKEQEITSKVIELSGSN